MALKVASSLVVIGDGEQGAPCARWQGPLLGL
jgi:hypothetical protein